VAQGDIAKDGQHTGTLIEVDRHTLDVGHEHSAVFAPHRHRQRSQRLPGFHLLEVRLDPLQHLGRMNVGGAQAQQLGAAVAQHLAKPGVDKNEALGGDIGGHQPGWHMLDHGEQALFGGGLR